MSAPDESPAKMVLYQAGDGSVRVECRCYNETLWLSLNEIAELFGRDKSVISKHLKNIFEEGELTRESVVANHATTAADGKTYDVDFYNLEAMGVQHFTGTGPTSAEIVVAKNYLSATELDLLNSIVMAYLEFAEVQAKRGRLMKMKDWAVKLDDFLKAGDHELLAHAGKISAEQAKAKAELEYDRYRRVLDAQPSAVDNDLAEAIKRLPVREGSKRL
jgi:hypothetical protein